MRILYVTNLWSGFADLVINGKSNPQGMPGFCLPLQALIESGVKVDFAIFTDYPEELNIGASWLKDCEYTFLVGKSFRNLSILSKLIRGDKYDFVYGQGSRPAFWANVFSMVHRKKMGARLYGTFMGDVLDTSIFKAVRKYRFEFALYNMPKQFLLTTNDGTKGDLVYEKFCFFKGAYDFHFWVNGFDKDGVDLTSEGKGALAIEFKERNFLLYPARFDPWKRQDMVVDIHHKLLESGVAVELVFCGHVFDREYFQEIKSKVQFLQTENKVHFWGPQKKEDLYYLLKHALAVPFCYEYSNFGNVLIEACNIGGVVVVRNDKSSDMVLEHGKTGFLFDSVDQAASLIGQLYEDRDLRTSIAINCELRSEKLFKSWSERVESEIDEILQHQKQGYT